MPIIRRTDGVFVERAPTLRRLMPFLMATRNEAVVYFEQQIEVAASLAFLQRFNEGRAAEHRATLFQLLLVAMARTLAMRPALNRFVVGRRAYQRSSIELSFAVKKQLTDAGGLTTVKVRLDPRESLAAALERIEARVGEGRGERPLRSETEMDIVTRLPRFLVRFVLWMQRLLDYHNLLPRSIIDSDPLYASAVLANLGSVGLESAYHHLFEYGTSPIFVTMGRVKKAVVPGDQDLPVVREVVSLKYSLDERVADGLYCARSLELIRGFLESPESLADPFEPPP
jgi:pyruvate/2-oxoglutarate dehydrogenase complex dihydrolipoamide acyltransferase (E2) component